MFSGILPKCLFAQYFFLATDSPLLIFFFFVFYARRMCLICIILKGIQEIYFQIPYCFFSRFEVQGNHNLGLKVTNAMNNNKRNQCSNSCGSIFIFTQQKYANTYDLAFVRGSKVVMSLFNQWIAARML